MVRLCVLSLGLLLCAACSSEKYSGSVPPEPRWRSAEAKTSVKAAVPLPWETWPLSRTLQGQPLTSPELLEGDEYLRIGDRRRALQVYKRIKAAGLSPAEREALVIRLASMELAIGDSLKSLSLMSKYFISNGKSEDDVDGRFSLVFAYAYGRRLQLDQSLAWFSRANRQLVAGAEQGVRLLLRSITDEELANLSGKWKTDSFVYTLIGQERRRRADPQYAAALPDGKAFWEIGEPIVAVSGERDGPRSILGEDALIVGAILPLSGQFAALGRATKNGIQLALEVGGGASGPGFPISVVYRDDGGNSKQSAALARELLEAQNATVVFGPLLTEGALQVSQVARAIHKPVITFSKSDSFQTGEEVFRLGPTVGSQVDSLLQICQRNFNFSRYAMVYPDDVTGQEFAASFRRKVRDLGFQVVFERSYPKNNPDVFPAIAGELEKVAVDALFFPDSLRAATRFFTSLSPVVRNSIRPLGTASWDNALELQQSRMALEGAVFVSPFFMASERPVVRQFVAAYKGTFQRNPDFLAAQGFDAATVVREALRRSRERNINVLEALQGVTLYDGLTGKITVRGNGEFERLFAVLALEDGNLRELPLEARNVITGAYSARTEYLSGR